MKGISFPNLTLKFALSDNRLYIFCALARVFARETVKPADTVAARTSENCVGTASITGLSP